MLGCRSAAACAKWVLPNRTLAQTALRFALALDGVSLALPSAVSIAQLDENIHALDTPMLTEAELAEMRQLEAQVRASSSSTTSSGTGPSAPVPGDLAKAVSGGALPHVAPSS